MVSVQIQRNEVVRAAVTTRVIKVPHMMSALLTIKRLVKRDEKESIRKRSVLDVALMVGLDIGQATEIARIAKVVEEAEVLVVAVVAVVAATTAVAGSILISAWTIMTCPLPVAMRIWLMILKIALQAALAMAVGKSCFCQVMKLHQVLRNSPCRKWASG